VIGSWVLREKRGTKREEIIRDGIKRHNKKPPDLNLLLNVIRVMKLWRMRPSDRIGRMGEWRGVYRVLVGRPEGKRPLGRPGRTWKDNIKVKLI